MESSEDKLWASKYLLDPLTAPEPSQESGINGAPVRRAASTSKGNSHTTSTVPLKGPYRHSKSSSSGAYPTPPTSASPTQSNFHPSNPYSPTHRQAAFGAYSSAGPSRKSSDEPIGPGEGKGRRRGSSLGERFPGDMSHRPLDVLRQQNKAADRSPHLKRGHIPGADIIDSLDNTVIGGAYHHGGPYDATLISRNNVKNPPIEAVRTTNAEALRATPRENIRDALDKHVPLQGTATIPPGMVGLDGRPMVYEEGADLMREPDAAGGAYKRWDHVKYLPGDFKGKGEPSYTIEKQLKEREQMGHRRIMSDGNSYEMQIPKHRSQLNRLRSASGSNADVAGSRPSGSALRVSGIEGDASNVQRSNTTGKRVTEGLKKRFGSLKKNRKVVEP